MEKIATNLLDTETLRNKSLKIFDIIWLSLL